MTDKPAAMAGVYVDMKFMPGLKMARISIEIPIEHSNAFIQMFGTPDRTNPVHVGIARLQEGAYAPAVPEKTEPAAPSVRAETKRSNRAAILCKENEDFQVWLAERYPDIWDRHYIEGDCFSPESADLTLKEVLGIASKTELDTNPEAAARFDALRTDFELRDLVR